MMKSQFSFIAIMFLCAITPILSTSKDHDVGGNKNSKYTGVFWHKVAKKWQATLKHNKQEHYGGLFDIEEHAAMKVNLLCEKYGEARKNPSIIIEPDAMQQFPNQTSQYRGVSWKKDNKKWQTHLMHNKKKYQGRYFDNEEQAAMEVNLLCDKLGIKRKNSMVIIEPDAMQQVSNLTSQYIGVSWHKGNKKWQATLMHKTQEHYGGYFDKEEYAAMKVNLLCDKYGIQRKNPMIIIEPDVIQKVPNTTSRYSAVSWNKVAKKWQAQVSHNKKKYHGGYFDIEEHAAMKVNLLCDKYGEARKNPMIIIEPDAMQKKTKSQLYQSKEENIVNKDEVKVEDTNILNGFKNECENLFMKNNDAENYIATASCQSQKRKRKD